MPYVLLSLAVFGLVTSTVFAGIAIVLQMRERMEEMNRQMQGFVDYVRTEMLTRMQQTQQPPAGLVPFRRPVRIVPKDQGKTRGE